MVRLLRIRSLQQMGFALDEIRECLDDKSFTPVRVLDMHLNRLRERLDQTGRLCHRLETLLQHLRGEQEVSVGEFLQAIEEMTMFEKYYTPEQLKQLEERRKQVGEDRIREVEAEWPRLIAEVRAEMAKGTDPADPKVLTLAARWQALVEEFTGGDEGIRQSLKSMYTNEPEASERQGLDPEIMSYVGRSMRRD